MRNEAFCCFRGMLLLPGKEEELESSLAGGTKARRDCSPGVSGLFLFSLPLAFWNQICERDSVTKAPTTVGFISTSWRDGDSNDSFPWILYHHPLLRLDHTPHKVRTEQGSISWTDARILPQSGSCADTSHLGHPHCVTPSFKNCVTYFINVFLCFPNTKRKMEQFISIRLNGI